MTHRSTTAPRRATLVHDAGPEQYRPVREWSLDSVRDLRSMRHELRDEMLAPALRSLTADDVVLVASELATNALEHGGAPAVLRLLVDGSGCLLDVADPDLTTTPHVAGARPAGAGGFGLAIAGRVATATGWYVAGPAKHVWAEFVPAGEPRDDGSVRLLHVVADQADVDRAVGVLRAGPPDRDEPSARAELQARSLRSGRSTTEQARAILDDLTG